MGGKEACVRAFEVVCLLGRGRGLGGVRVRCSAAGRRRFLGSSSAPSSLLLGRYYLSHSLPRRSRRRRFRTKGLLEVCIWRVGCVRAPPLAGAAGYTAACLSMLLFCFVGWVWKDYGETGKMLVASKILQE